MGDQFLCPQGTGGTEMELVKFISYWLIGGILEKLKVQIAFLSDLTQCFSFFVHNHSRSLFSVPSIAFVFFFI